MIQPKPARYVGENEWIISHLDEGHYGVAKCSILGCEADDTCRHKVHYFVPRGYPATTDFVFRCRKANVRYAKNEASPS